MYNNILGFLILEFNINLMFYISMLGFIILILGFIIPWTYNINPRV